MKKAFTFENDEGEEFVVEFPARYEVCSCCEGRGTTYLGWHAADQPALTAEDFAEEGPEFREDYMSGAYDRDCPECRGQRVTLEVDEEQAAADMPEAYAELIRQRRADADYEALCRMERRMEGGW